MTRNPIRTILLEVLDNAFDTRSWHGANLMGAVRGVRASQANLRIGRRKTIREQVLHAAYWKHRVLTTLDRNAGRFPRKGSNWPRAANGISETAWSEDIEMLRELHRRLRACVASMRAIALSKHKTRWLIEGAAAHDLYHAGQIKLMRRLTDQIRRR